MCNVTVCVINKPKIDVKRKNSILVLNMKYEHCPCLLIIFKIVIDVYDDVLFFMVQHLINVS